MSPWEIAEAILAAQVAAFEADGAPFVRNYVSDGSVVFDFDETLAVEWERNEPVPTSDGSYSPADFSSGIVTMQSVFGIFAMRHTPWPDEVGTPPTPLEIQTNAQLVHADAKRVLDTLSVGLRDGSLFGHCGQVTLYSQNMFGPDGGSVGSITRIAVGQ